MQNWYETLEKLTCSRLSFSLFLINSTNKRALSKSCRSRCQKCSCSFIALILSDLSLDWGENSKHLALKIVKFSEIRIKKSVPEILIRTTYFISTSFLTLMAGLKSSQQWNSIPGLSFQHPIALKTLNKLSLSCHGNSSHNLTESEGNAKKKNKKKPRTISINPSYPNSGMHTLLAVL